MAFRGLEPVKPSSAISIDGMLRAEAVSGLIANDNRFQLGNEAGGGKVAMLKARR
jgi:hypothetical protein